MWGEDRERGRDREEEEEKKKEEKGRRTTLGGGGMGIIRTQQYFQKGTACFRKFSWLHHDPVAQSLEFLSR